MKFRKWPFLFLSCVLAACGSPQTDPQNLRLNFTADPGTLDPRLCQDYGSAALAKMLFDGLMRWNPDGNLLPSVAERVEISSDGLTCTFFLRECLWSDGQPVVAEDFALAWRTSLLPEIPSGEAFLLFPIKNARAVKDGDLPVETLGVHVLGDRLLKVELASPNPYFLELTTHSVFYPVPSHLLEQGLWPATEGSFVGNGPFRLLSWRKGSSLDLEKNPLYWDAQSVQIGQIHASVVTDETTELRLFERGELDWAGSPLSSPPTAAKEALKRQGLLRSQPAAANYWYVFNTRKEPFNHSKMRRAFSYAINRQEIVEHVTGTGQMANTSPLPHGMRPHDLALFQDHQSQFARQLFEEALDEMGLTRETLPPVTISYSTFEIHRQIAQTVQQTWQQIFEIPIHLECYEWQVQLDRLSRGDFCIARSGIIACSNDPLEVLRMFAYPNACGNWGAWAREDFLKLVLAADAAQDLERRQEIARSAEEILADEMPVAPIYDRTFPYVQNPDLEDVVFTHLGQWDFKWAHLKKT